MENKYLVLPLDTKVLLFIIIKVKVNCNYNVTLRKKALDLSNKSFIVIIIGNNKKIKMLTQLKKFLIEKSAFESSTKINYYVLSTFLHFGVHSMFK